MCPGGPESPGGPWNPCARVFTRKVWAGEGEAGQRQHPEIPASPLPRAVPALLRVHATPCGETKCHHDSHPHLLKFKEQLECVASEL